MTMQCLIQRASSRKWAVTNEITQVNTQDWWLDLTTDGLWGWAGDRGKFVTIWPPGISIKSVRRVLPACLSWIPGRNCTSWRALCTWWANLNRQNLCTETRFPAYIAALLPSPKETKHPHEHQSCSCLANVGIIYSELYSCPGSSSCWLSVAQAATLPNAPPT